MLCLNKVLVKGEVYPLQHIISELITEDQKAFVNSIIGSLAVVFLEAQNDLKPCDCLIDDQKQRLTIYSRFVPFGTRITIPLVADEYCKINDFFDQIIYIEEAPYAFEKRITQYKEIVEHLYDDAHCMVKTFKIVLYRDKKVQNTYGEEKNIDVALEEAPGKIVKALGIEGNRLMIKHFGEGLFYVYKEPIDMLRILHLNGRNTKMSINTACKMKYENWKKEFEDAEYFDMIYGEDVSSKCEEAFASPDKLRDVTDYKAVRGSKNIRKTYTEVFLNRFGSALREIASEFYKARIQEICFWDLKRDVELLESDIVNGLCKEINNNMDDCIGCPRSEADYNSEIRNKLQCDTSFSKSIHSFIRCGLKDSLKKRLERKQKILSEIYSD